MNSKKVRPGVDKNATTYNAMCVRHLMSVHLATHCPPVNDVCRGQVSRHTNVKLNKFGGITIMNKLSVSYM